MRSVIEARMDSKLLQRVDPSDIVQEALLEAFSRFGEYQQRQPMPITCWLRETAIQQLQIAVRRHVTAEKRSVLKQISYEHSSIFHLAEQMTAIVETPDEAHARSEDLHRALCALSRLGETDREILMLRYLNGLSNTEAALVLGVSETVASKRHCRALVRLQAALE
jgi:RNA polymerase sigma-70 factor (ECF subfamily)